MDILLENAGGGGALGGGAPGDGARSVGTAGREVLLAGDAALWAGGNWMRSLVRVRGTSGCACTGKASGRM